MRTALEVHVLTLRARDVAAQIKILTDPPCSKWFTENELIGLRNIWNSVLGLADAAAAWEKLWKARLESSPKNGCSQQS